MKFSTSTYFLVCNGVGIIYGYSLADTPAQIQTLTLGVATFMVAAGVLSGYLENRKKKTATA